MSLIWHRPKALVIFHAVIKLDPKLETQCLAWEARSRLGDVRKRPVDSRYIVMCERAPDRYSRGQLIVRQTFTLFDLPRQVVVGDPVGVTPDAFDTATIVILREAGLRVFERNAETETEFVSQQSGKRYALRKNAQGVLEVIVTQKYSARAQCYRETHPNGTFKRGGRGYR